MKAAPQDVTQLLQAWRNGDATALNQLMPLVQDELHAVAHRYLARRRPGELLQTAVLVNEVYLRLAKLEKPAWQDRAHFIAFCAVTVRNLLVDHFRRQREQVTLSEAAELPQAQQFDLLALHEALSKLARIDARSSRVVELRFFGGLTNEEIAEVMDLSIPTIKREWQKAKAWLYRELQGESQR